MNGEMFPLGINFSDPASCDKENLQEINFYLFFIDFLIFSLSLDSN